jgi:hypothetical protein
VLIRSGPVLGGVIFGHRSICWSGFWARSARVRFRGRADGELSTSKYLSNCSAVASHPGGGIDEAGPDRQDEARPAQVQRPDRQGAPCSGRRGTHGRSRTGRSGRQGNPDAGRARCGPPAPNTRHRDPAQPRPGTLRTHRRTGPTRFARTGPRATGPTPEPRARKPSKKPWTRSKPAAPKNKPAATRPAATTTRRRARTGAPASADRDGPGTMPMLFSGLKMAWWWLGNERRMILHQGTKSLVLTSHRTPGSEVFSAYLPLWQIPSRHEHPPRPSTGQRWR